MWVGVVAAIPQWSVDCFSRLRLICNSYATKHIQKGDFLSPCPGLDLIGMHAIHFSVGPSWVNPSPWDWAWIMLVTQTPVIISSWQHLLSTEGSWESGSCARGNVDKQWIASGEKWEVGSNREQRLINGTPSSNEGITNPGQLQWNWELGKPSWGGWQK